MPLLLSSIVASEANDVGDIIFALFLDLQKAFDTANHHILLRTSKL